MSISIFDLFTIGIGPSSSHTVGPMRAALLFAEKLEDAGLLDQVSALEIRLYGSLGATGHGYGSHKAVLLSLEGETSETADVNAITDRMAEIEAKKTLNLLGRQSMPFDPGKDLIFEKRYSLPGYSNGLRFHATDGDGNALREGVYYSVGGGFVVAENDTDEPVIAESRVELPHAFESGEELLELCRNSGTGLALGVRRFRRWLVRRSA